MALIHRATVTPPKLALLSGWLPGRAWFTDSGELESVGAYRFDDPAGEVGVEAFILRGDGGTCWHVPLTYRAAPLDDAEAQLVGTTEHSVLGTRWVYDGCADPVWAAALARAILTAGTQADELVDTEDGLQPRKPTATVVGSGIPGTPVDVIDGVRCHDDGDTSVIGTATMELVVVRAVGVDVSAPYTLTGRWSSDERAVLAGVRLL